MKTNCQLMESTAIGKEVWRRWIGRQVRRVGDILRGGFRYTIRCARGAIRRVARTVGGPAYPVTGPTVAARSGNDDEAFAPGTRVRVRSREAIEATLDARRRCHGCPFAEPMFQYCGREYRVAKPVRYFFDETCRRLVTCRNIVLLKGVFCDGSGYPESCGCDRTCFFFWHTKWLERVEP